jgi:hypothetical protein
MLLHLSQPVLRDHPYLLFYTFMISTAILYEWSVLYFAALLSLYKLFPGIFSGCSENYEMCGAFFSVSMSPNDLERALEPSTGTEILNIFRQDLNFSFDGRLSKGLCYGTPEKPSVLHRISEYLRVFPSFFTVSDFLPIIKQKVDDLT